MNEFKQNFVKKKHMKVIKISLQKLTKVAKVKKHHSILTMK